MKKRLTYIQWTLAGLILVLSTLAVFYFPLDADYTAGEIWDHYQHWQASGILYPKLSNQYFHVLNYPPLFFYLVKALNLLGISALTAGRTIALSSSLLTLWVIYAWLKKTNMERSQNLSVLSLLISCSFPFIYASSQFHLEPTATLLTVCAYYLLYLSLEKPYLLVPAALSLTLACITKQTQAVFFITAALWSMRYHRKTSWLFLLAAAFFTIISLALMQHQFGNNIWLHTVHYTIGSYSLQQLVRQLASYFLPWIIFASLALRLAWKESYHKNPAYWYFAASTAWLISCSRLGASSQYFTDWCIATLIYIAPHLQSYCQSKWKYFLALQVSLATILVIIIESYVFIQLRADYAAFKQICPIILQKAKDQAIVSENVDWARRCGAQAVINPFIMSNLSSLELWDQNIFLETIKRKQYPLIVLPFDPNQAAKRLTAERWTSEMLNYMAQYYQVSERFGNYFVLTPNFSNNG